MTSVLYGSHRQVHQQADHAKRSVKHQAWNYKPALYSTTVHSHLHGINLKPLNQLHHDEMIIALLVRKPCKCACTRLPLHPAVPKAMDITDKILSFRDACLTKKICY